MATTTAEPDIEMGLASLGDIASLSTIIARAFHPVNPFFKKCFPDTPSMRQWWSKVFTAAVTDPHCDIIVIRSRKEEDSAKLVLGVISMRCMREGEQGAGLWTMHGLIEDHDRDALLPVGETMAEHRTRLMSNRSHYLLEILSVDQSFKGMGLGGMLLQAACRRADEEGLDTFVQSNTMTKGLYFKYGFEEDCQAVVPGGFGYVEWMLMRESRTRAKSRSKSSMVNGAPS